MENLPTPAAPRRRPWLQRLPGWLAGALLLALLAGVTYWCFGEMYHEGWWGPFYIRLVYLIPFALLLTLTLIAFAHPRLGGALLLAAGIAVALLLLEPRFEGGRLVVDQDFSGLVIAGGIILFGALFLWEARSRRRWAQRHGPPPRPRSWLLRRLPTVLALGIPALIITGISAVMLPVVLTRVDDGDRGARRIEGNGVTLIWAPAGPGWNWKQSWGGYPSWAAVALYGVEPVGMEPKAGYRNADGSWDRLPTAAEMATTDLCRYLTADGLTLLDTPQNIWRMPTVEELVRSLGKHGANAGCTWEGQPIPAQAVCAVQPDKETPLWAPDLSPVYYWAADEYDARRAYFVAYNGMVNATLKNGGNPRHTTRCVREP